MEILASVPNVVMVAHKPSLLLPVRTPDVLLLHPGNAMSTHVPENVSVVWVMIISETAQVSGKDTPEQDGIATSTVIVEDVKDK